MAERKAGSLLLAAALLAAGLLPEGAPAAAQEPTGASPTTAPVGATTTVPSPPTTAVRRPTTTTVAPAPPTSSGAATAPAAGAATVPVSPLEPDGLTLSPQTGPADAPTVGLVGDSILFEALFHFDKTVKRDRRIAFSATGLAYRIRTVLPAVRAEMRRADRPDIMVVFIGTSQSQYEPPARWERELRRLMDAMSPRVSCIRVFDISDDPTGYYLLHDRQAAAYNRVTRRVVSGYANAEWYHYERWAERAGPEYEKRDTLHHNEAGRVQIARLVRHATNSCDPALTSGPYWDVPDDHPAAEAIAWVGEQNLFPGYPNGTYRAEIGTFPFVATRGALLNMAWKAAGRPVGFAPHPWSDGNRALNRAMRWAAATGVSDGFPNGTYRPDDPVTRGQALALAWRMSGRRHGFPDDPWSDASGTHFRWAAANRLLGGTGGGRFGPDRPLTRGQAATLLFRVDRLPDDPP